MNKVLLVDVETSPNISYTWHGKYEQTIIDFLEEGGIISVAYKWLGEKRVRSFCLGEMKKEKLIKKLHDLFEEADIIIGHNTNNFDIKMANREFVKYGLTPPSPYKVVDTLNIARSKFRFNSNRLDDLGEYLGLGRKLKVGGFDLWKECMHGDKKAYKKMMKYNRQDVILLEKVYLELRAWATTVPTIAKQNGYICPLCGSKNVWAQGWKYMTTYKRKQYQCRECGRWSTSQEKIKIKTEYLS